MTVGTEEAVVVGGAAEAADAVVAVAIGSSTEDARLKDVDNEWYKECNPSAIYNVVLYLSQKSDKFYKVRWMVIPDRR